MLRFGFVITISLPTVSTKICNAFWNVAMVCPSLKLVTSSGLRTIRGSVCVDLSQVDRLLDSVLVDTFLIW